MDRKDLERARRIIDSCKKYSSRPSEEERIFLNNCHWSNLLSGADAQWVEDGFPTII